MNSTRASENESFAEHSRGQESRSDIARADGAIRADALGAASVPPASSPARTPRAPAPITDHPTPRAQSHRTLIVEDERRLREMLLTSIREMGFEPAAAPSGEAALRLLGEAVFAVAVLDLNLPGMGGIELAEAMRVRWPSMQIIILTGFGDLDSARRAIHLDIVDFLIKPCGMNELESALCRAQARWLQAWAVEQAPDVPPQEKIAPPAPSATDCSTSSASLEGRSSPAVMSLEEMERQLILETLERRHGNRQAAADDLGISLRKLYYRLHQYQQAGFLPLDREDF